MRAQREFIDHNAYLKSFFAELERLRPVPGWARPHRSRAMRIGFHTSGIQSGVNGTPTFFINGLRHNGSFDFDALVSAIQRAVV